MTGYKFQYRDKSQRTVCNIQFRIWIKPSSVQFAFTRFYFVEMYFVSILSDIVDIFPGVKEARK